MAKDTASGQRRMDKVLYEQELARLQQELVALQEWVKATGQRVIVIFEGRDAAGKGGAIKRITEALNPRVVRVVALPAPSEREKTQWYFQRYIQHLPAAGEIVLFDRSWYNRAGVERVMGFCTDDEYERFLRQTPEFEKMLVNDGILLRKYWFSVSDVEQEARFRSRATDPMRQWKLSPMDMQSISRWEDYSRAKDRMMESTDTGVTPWYTVESEDKRAARINSIAHLLASIPYEHIPPAKIEIPDRPPAVGYARPPRETLRYVPDHAGTVGAAATAVSLNGSAPSTNGKKPGSDSKKPAKKKPAEDGKK
ncbi:polyphosphate kinase 2 [Millisia brevis]|uniref:polyphosphate kinase 2 n=1 Tax=Millisia brevis TaxID=264148 RepID=UPI000A0248BB|nr:polyphosphate kinase 2 [Millisia brevis]